MFSSFFNRARPAMRPCLSLQLLEGRDVPTSIHGQWIDLNGDGLDESGEYFAQHGNRLVRLGDEPAEGMSPPGAIRWIDVNHDRVRQANETFLFLPNGDLERVTLSGPTVQPCLINDLRRFGPQGYNVTPSDPTIHWLINDLRRFGDWQDDNNNPQSGQNQNQWYDQIHGGVAGISIVCNGRVNCTIIRFNNGLVSEVTETVDGKGQLASRTRTDHHPDGSVDRTQEVKNADGSTTTTRTHWNADGSGSISKETTKDGKTTKKQTAEYDKKGDKVAQTEQVGDKKKEWTKDPKSKAWSNNEDQSAKKPPNEQKGGMPEKLPPKPAKPK